MAHEFTTTRRVEFADTDMAGIAHFSNFFRWMESVEHEFFRSLGLSVHNTGPSASPTELGYGFARVHASCDYAQPARYQDVLSVRLSVCKKTRKSFGYELTFHLADAEIARGRLDVVCVSRAPGEERIRAIDIPASITREVEVAPEHAAPENA